MPPITGRGINQADLASLLTLIRTNFIGVTAKLDADTGVADTNYGALWNFTVPITISGAGIRHQGDVLNYLKSIRTAYMGVLAKLDADGTVTDANYAATNPMADLVDNLALGSLTQAGQYEGALVKWLSTYIAAWNATLTKLDADATVNGADYNSLWAISTLLVDAEGCVNKP